MTFEEDFPACDCCGCSEDNLKELRFNRDKLCFDCNLYVLKLIKEIEEKRLDKERVRNIIDRAIMDEEELDMNRLSSDWNKALLSIKKQVGL